jgi:putative tricarboxylic transport membrane protein
MSYGLAKRLSKRGKKFGSGEPEGIVAPETADHAAGTSAMLPMLALGIPGSASTAVLLAALILQGIQPGPMLMVQHADLVWGLIASMFIGNLILLVLNLPLVPVFASLLRVPYDYLAPAILVVSLTGAFAMTLNIFTVLVAIGFGLVGYGMIKFNVPRSPLVLAVVLAPLLESSLRQSLMLSLGSPMIFIQRPISAILLAAVLGSIILPVIATWRRRKQERAVQTSGASV